MTQTDINGNTFVPDIPPCPSCAEKDAVIRELAACIIDGRLYQLNGYRDARIKKVVQIAQDEIALRRARQGKG
jgi:hypothetical protein